MIEDRIFKIMEQILQTNVSEETNISIQTCENWTSLTHIDLIMSIEEEFNILFSETDLPVLNSQEALVKRVKELANQ